MKKAVAHDLCATAPPAFIRLFFHQESKFILKLYDSDKIVGLVDRETFEFHLQDAGFPYAGGSKHNQAVQ